ncbi:MAG: CusA/CzcA family heavy metal efflux RND transporter [Verrucomicrobiota bacterium]
MLNGLITWSLNNRLMVCILALTGVLIGGKVLMHLPIDAFPDTTPVQVQINTTAPALNPTEIEAQITLPIELAVSGLPGLNNVRSVSKFGLSQVVATFDDDSNIITARQLISERLSAAELPEGVPKPELGPISTGLGEVFHYVLRSDNPDRTLTELRELHDWVVKPEMLKVAGTAEINSWGGYEKQFQVLTDPGRLIKYGLTFDDLFEALEKNNQNVGGGILKSSGVGILVHGVGIVTTIEDIENIVVKSVDGIPVRVKSVAEVAIGHEIRRGAVTADGKGEVVLGLGFMLMGENSHEVTRNLKKQLEQVQKALPEDVRVETVYDRTDLVDKVIETVSHNLLVGAILVVVVLFVLIGNLRAGLIVASAIPLSLVFAGTYMLEAGIAASLLSLGALDFGLVVDGSVVMVENMVRRLADEQHRLGRKLMPDERSKILKEAPLEVARPVAFGVGIIIIVFVPILTLEGIEGKLFKPMALTMIAALLGSLILALTVVPVLATLFLPRSMKEKDPLLIRMVQYFYQPILKAAMRLRYVVLVVALALVVVSAAMAMRMGGEFLPKLGEGALVVNVIRLAGIDLEQSTAYNTRIERILLDEFPDEIGRAWSRIGAAEVATDPMGTELTDIFLALNPRGEWTKAETQAELTAKIDELLRDLPGLNMSITQPIEMRMNEMVAGIRSDVGIKIYGDDFEKLTRVSDDIQRVLLDVEGSVDISGEQLTGQPVLQIKVKPEAIARYGIPTRAILGLVEAMGGIEVGEIREGQRRFPLVIRLPEKIRNDVELLGNTLIPTEGGPFIPLKRLADITMTEGPATIQREWSKRRVTVQTNVRGRDVGSFVAEAQKKIDEEVDMPEGYTLQWGGQFENMERANQRLMLVVPLSLGLIFVLLFFSLNSLRQVFIVATGIPLGAVGGVAALYLRDMPFTVSAAIGFIALSGVAILNGLVLISFIQNLISEGKEVRVAVFEGCRIRLRPVLMTALVAAVGFIPMALNTGVGAEVQRPLATVVIGGIISNTVLTLVVLPVLFVMFGVSSCEVDAVEKEIEV